MTAGPIAPRLQGRELTASRGTNETRPDGEPVSPRTSRRRPTYLPDRQSKTKNGGPSTRLGDRPSRWFLGDAVSPSSRAASLPLAGHPASFGLSLLRAHQGIARRGTASFGARIPEDPPPRGRRVDSCCPSFESFGKSKEPPSPRNSGGGTVFPGVRKVFPSAAKSFSNFVKVSVVVFTRLIPVHSALVYEAEA